MKGYRTIAIGVLTMLAAAVQSSTGVLTPETAGLAMSVIGALMIGLRAITTTPAFSADPAPEVIGA